MAAVVRAAVARALSRSVEADDVFACAVTSPTDFDDAVMTCGGRRCQCARGLTNKYVRSIDAIGARVATSVVDAHGVEGRQVNHALRRVHQLDRRRVRHDVLAVEAE